MNTESGSIKSDYQIIYSSHIYTYSVSTKYVLALCQCSDLSYSGGNE